MKIAGLLFLSALIPSTAALAQNSTATPPAAQQATPAQTQTAPGTAPDALPDSPDSGVAPSMAPTGPTVVFDTSMGRMTCRFFDQQAPQTVANFIGLATGTKDWTDPATHEKVHGKPFYDGTTFHRVIPGFMIQGGDPLGTGEGDPGYMFNDELNSNLNFDVPGRLAMANSGPNTNGSQFFITEDIQPKLDQGYTIFGQCDDASVQVVKSIARVETGAQNKPVSPVVLEHVTIVPVGQPLPAEPKPATAASPAAPSAHP